MNMDIDAYRKLISAWIQLYTLDSDSPQRGEWFWSYRQLDDLVEKNPQLAWKAILDILSIDRSDRIMNSLAAGPLEDLLVRHGADFIDKVELEAQRSIFFRSLLGGVWKNAIQVDVWKRVQAAAGN